MSFFLTFAFCFYSVATDCSLYHSAITIQSVTTVHSINSNNSHCTTTVITDHTSTITLYLFCTLLLYLLLTVKHTTVTTLYCYPVNMLPFKLLPTVKYTLLLISTTVKYSTLLFHSVTCCFHLYPTVILWYCELKSAFML